MIKVIIAFVLGVILSGTVLEVWYMFNGASILDALIERVIPLAQTIVINP